MYQSDITRFLNELKAGAPETERRQREGRAIFWDKQLDLDELKRWHDARVPQQGYVYQTEPKRESGQ
jgi:hypothetical protein